MKKPAEKRILRARSKKLKGHADLSTVVCQAVAAALTITNPIKSVKKIPTPAFMRSRMIPAYEAVAKVFGPAFDIEDLTGEDLYGLSIDASPVLGSFKISVNHLQSDGKTQPLMVHFHAADGENMFTRLVKDRGVDEAQAFVESI